MRSLDPLFRDDMAGADALGRGGFSPGDGMAAEFTVAFAIHRHPRIGGVESWLPDADRHFQESAADAALWLADFRGVLKVGTLINDAIGLQPHQRRLAALAFQLPPASDRIARRLIGVTLGISGDSERHLPGVAKTVKQCMQPALHRHLAGNPNDVIRPVNEFGSFLTLIVLEGFIRDPHTKSRMGNVKDHGSTIYRRRAAKPNKNRTKSLTAVSP